MPKKKLAVLTSGGDAPGMNAAIRSVVRTGLQHGWTILGVERGYAGLIEGALVALNARDVGGVMQRGGTMLGSARCPEFSELETRCKAVDVLSRHEVDGLVVIGGNGSQAGAAALAHMGIPVVGVASTIDNDLPGSDVTIGVDTALNIALEAIDRLKTTAASHHRAFLVEVMGRNCGYLALLAGLAGGAEVVVIPEVEIDPDQVAVEFHHAYALGKTHAIGVIAEGAEHNATALAHHFSAHRDDLGFDLRITLLGHVQRGGIPSAADRLLATQLGAGAVECLARGEHGVLVGLVKGDVVSTPFDEVVGVSKPLDPRLLELARSLAI